MAMAEPWVNNPNETTITMPVWHQFKPTKDITAYEIALILEDLHVGVQADHVKDLPEQIRRYFPAPEKESKE